MIIRPSTYSIDTFYKYYVDNDIIFDYATQRTSDQWNREQKSLLIDSALRNMDIPTLYIQEITADSNGKKWIIIDGIQRLSTIFGYIDDKFSLSGDIEPIEFDGNLYTIAGKKFSKLPKAIQKEFLKFPLEVKFLIDFTNRQVEELFFRLNNGSGFTKQQIATVNLGTELVKIIKPVTEHKFWKRTGFTPAQKKHGHILATVLTTLMLMTEYDYGGKLGVTQVCRYAQYLHELYKKGESKELTAILEALEKLDKAITKLNNCTLDEDINNAFLKPINIPMLLMQTVDFMDYNEGNTLEDTVMDEDFYTAFITDFIETVTIESEEENEYKKNCGKSSTNKTKVEGRLNALNNAYYEFCDMSKYGDIVVRGDNPNIII